MANANWSVYLLKCPRGLYCGITTDPVRRLEMHRSGLGAKSVRALGYPEQMRVLHSGMTQSDALKREAAIKKLAVHLKRNIFETEYLKAYA